VIAITRSASVNSLPGPLAKAFPTGEVLRDEDVPQSNVPPADHVADFDLDRRIDFPAGPPGLH
jgi:hypothetical protein